MVNVLKIGVVKFKVVINISYLSKLSELSFYLGFFFVYGACMRIFGVATTDSCNYLNEF